MRLWEYIITRRVSVIDVYNTNEKSNATRLNMWCDEDFKVPTGHPYLTLDYFIGD